MENAGRRSPHAGDTTEIPRRAMHRSRAQPIAATQTCELRATVPPRHTRRALGRTAAHNRIRIYTVTHISVPNRGHTYHTNAQSLTDANTLSTPPHRTTHPLPQDCQDGIMTHAQLLVVFHCLRAPRARENGYSNGSMHRATRRTTVQCITPRASAKSGRARPAARQPRAHSLPM